LAMYVTHSLVPHSTGRLPAKRADTLIFSDQLQVPSTPLSNTKNIPDEWVYEGELLEKGYSSDTNSRYRTHRVFTQHRSYSEFINENQPMSGKRDAIEMYIRNAELNGANHPVYEHVLDVYV